MTVLAAGRYPVPRDNIHVPFFLLLRTDAPIQSEPRCFGFPHATQPKPTARRIFFPAHSSYPGRTAPQPNEECMPKYCIDRFFPVQPLANHLWNSFYFEATKSYPLVKGKTMPPKEPMARPWNLSECVAVDGKKKSADVIELKILGWEDNLGLPWWANIILKVLI